VKSHSSKWIKEQLKRSAFSWQTGYGAFSVSQSTLPSVHDYISNQEEHHRSRSFQEEYLLLLEKHQVAYDEKYLW